MLNIPDSPYERIVVVGGGFAGYNLVKKLRHKKYQVVLIDRNNFHQFQPLFYQVAMAGLEPSSIVFPMRKAFQKSDNITIRVAELEEIKHESKRIVTNEGEIYYDHLVLCIGAKTNFYGNKQIEENTFSLKSVSEALHLRNAILIDFEKALLEEDYDKRQGYIDIAIVGGGPTGVELAGALAEMKKYILPKDYRELDTKEVDIYLIQSGDSLLKGMSTKSAQAAEQYLRNLGVKVLLNQRVKAFDGTTIETSDGSQIACNKVIWAAGIHSQRIAGLPDEVYSNSNRILIDDQLKVVGLEQVYCLGDQAIMKSEEKPYGDPQVAQVAIQHAHHFVRALLKNQNKPFVYKDLGSMATVGRNKAVADLPNMIFKGFLAWVLWLIVHIRSLIGFKNKLFVMINWMWSYLTYDQSLRLIIKPFTRKKSNKP